METDGRLAASPGDAARGADRGRVRRFAELNGGGTEGNRRLTALTGATLIVLLAVIGVTILRIGQLTSVHLFVGLLPIGPVLLKMASTGYRFARYYTHDGTYRRKGPPDLGLRVIAPVVVLSTVVVFASGVVSMFEGRDNQGQWLLIHKVSFFVWVAFTALHVLGHLAHLGESLRADVAERGRIDRCPGAGDVASRSPAPCRGARAGGRADSGLRAVDRSPGLPAPSTGRKDPTGRGRLSGRTQPPVTPGSPSP